MKKLPRNLVALVCIVLMLSCGKKIDGTTTPPPTPPPPPAPAPQSPIVRNWTFISMQVKHEYMEEKTIGVDRLKRVVKTGYTTVKNGGSCLFDQTRALSDSLTYEVNTMEKIYMYRNDTLLSASDSPLVFNVMHSGHVSDYTLVGTDSLRMNSGPMKIKPNVASQPVSVKLKFENEKLYMTYKLQIVKPNPGSQIAPLCKPPLPLWLNLVSDLQHPVNARVF